MKYTLPILILQILSFLYCSAQPNLNTYFSNYHTSTSTYSFTGAQVTATAPTDAIGMHLKIWGAGGGHEIIGSTDAGCGGFTESVFTSTVVSPATQFSVIVGGGGNRASTRPPDGSCSSSFGFGGCGTHDMGGGLSGVFTGTSSIVNTEQSRALSIAGGGGGMDDSGSSNSAGGTNGNGSNSGGVSGSMQGSTDNGYAQGTCADSFYPANYFSSGGGGYEGGGQNEL